MTSNSQERVWNIPAERMKENKAHFVPLSSQSLECLAGLQKITGNYELLFPKRGQRTKKSVREYRTKMVELEEVENIARSVGVLAGPRRRGRRVI
jgi:integrase